MGHTLLHVVVLGSIPSTVHLPLVRAQPGLVMVTTAQHMGKLRHGSKGCGRVGHAGSALSWATE